MKGAGLVEGDVDFRDGVRPAEKVSRVGGGVAGGVEEEASGFEKTADLAGDGERVGEMFEDFDGGDYIEGRVCAGV